MPDPEIPAFRFRYISRLSRGFVFTSTASLFNSAAFKSAEHLGSLLLNGLATHSDRGLTLTAGPIAPPRVRSFPRFLVLSYLGHVSPSIAQLLTPPISLPSVTNPAVTPSNRTFPELLPCIFNRPCCHDLEFPSLSSVARNSLGCLPSWPLPSMTRIIPPLSTFEGKLPFHDFIAESRFGTAVSHSPISPSCQWPLSQSIYEPRPVTAHSYLFPPSLGRPEQSPKATLEDRGRQFLPFLSPHRMLKGLSLWLIVE